MLLWRRVKSPARNFFWYRKKSNVNSNKLLERKNKMAVIDNGWWIVNTKKSRKILSFFFLVGGVNEKWCEQFWSERWLGLRERERERERERGSNDIRIKRIVSGGKEALFWLLIKIELAIYGIRQQYINYTRNKGCSNFVLYESISLVNGSKKKNI